MSVRQTLQELAQQVRTRTREILAAARPEWLTWAPPGTSNHLLWHAGHAVWLMDVLGIELLTGRSELPPGWSEKFGMRCRPPYLTCDWPDRALLDRMLADQLDRIGDGGGAVVVGVVHETLLRSGVRGATRRTCTRTRKI